MNGSTSISNSLKEANSSKASFNNGKGDITSGSFSGNLFDIWQGQLSRKDQNQKC